VWSKIKEKVTRGREDAREKTRKAYTTSGCKPDLKKPLEGLGVN
jgi:hypothetical protein